MAELAKLFGQRVRALRADVGLTQADLAERTRKSEEWVRRIERGEGAPSFGTIEAIAEALQVRPADLFSERPLSPAETFAAVTEGLDEEAVRWLLSGARLLRGHRRA